MAYKAKHPWFRDCRGVKIRLGDTLAYPVYTDGKLEMKVAVVCEVPGKGCTITNGVVVLSPARNRTIIKRTDRSVVVKRFEELED